MSQSGASNVLAFPFNRRKSERIPLKDFFKVFMLLDYDKLISLTIIDVGNEGCAFRMDHRHASIPSLGQEIKTRFYFNDDTFISLSLRIKNSRSHVEDDSLYTIIGCHIIPGDGTTLEVYQKFISFIRFYSENAQKDLNIVKAG